MIVTVLHLNNNRGADGARLGQLQTLFTQFQDADTLEEHLTTEEAICPLSGYIFFYVYTKASYIRIKIFQFCDSRSGYNFNLEVHTRTQPTDSENNNTLNDIDG